MKPRLLLVEDDPVSCSFMAAALEALPACVVCAASMQGALDAERDDASDLWLVDANLPDGSGAELLARLRNARPGIPALAHTADDSPALHARLRQAGFAEVLVKPLPATDLQDAVRRWLELAPAAAVRIGEAASGFAQRPLWDQAAALAALNGSHEHVATLRRMFLDELPRQHDAVVSALERGDGAMARQVLHQLKASSGFVGALRLNAAATILDQAPDQASALAEFAAIVQDTLATG